MREEILGGCLTTFSRSPDEEAEASTKRFNAQQLMGKRCGSLCCNMVGRWTSLKRFERHKVF